jgi:molecular chaperone GrpE
MIMSKKKDKLNDEEVVTEEISNDSQANELNEKINKMQAQIDEFRCISAASVDKALRAQAELQNYKKRKDEETDKMIKFANEDLIEKILPTLDNFERAIKLDDNNLTDEISKFLDGFKMIYTSLVNVLNDLGLKEIDAIDKPFDPAYHQAVLTDRDEAKEDGIVLEVLQKGYMLQDRVIRASMVKVNNL